jgi:peptidoglycan/LPS O-acetylase OafA/YrhL
MTIQLLMHAGARRPPEKRHKAGILSAEFRKDINGLRAYAVLSVVLYHFGFPGFDGGFAGVDVFFVISGFLMTSIILGKLGKGTFSLSDFYARRAYRIIPALSVLGTILLAFGYVWLTPTDYKTLGRHVASANVFISNFVFNGEDGYFDTPMRDKWMLHTWSLSVEWQFYMLYPFFLMPLARLKASASGHRYIISGFLIIAFAASIVMASAEPTAAFYLLPCRIWEFLAGGIVYLLPQVLKERDKCVLEAAGLALVLASNILFSHETAWPGAAAAVPVIGTCMIIFASRNNSALTANNPAQALGRWSYSIYLWHWPVYVGIGYFGLAGPATAAGAVIASIILGALSYAFVEQTFLRWRHRKFPALGVMMLVPIAFSALVSVQQGFPNRVSDTLRRIDRASLETYHGFMRNCHFDEDEGTRMGCPIGPEGETKFILWGDSHARAVASAIVAASGASGVIYSANCATTFNAYPKSRPIGLCKGFNEAVLKDIRKFPKEIPVIIVNRFSIYLWGHNEGTMLKRGLIYTGVSPEETAHNELDLFKATLEKSFCRIAAERKVFVMQPVPEMGRNVPKTISRALMTGGRPDDIYISAAEYSHRHKAALDAISSAQKTCNVVPLDPAPYLCRDGKCFGSVGRQPLYFDDDHLSERGNKKLIPMFQQVFSGRANGKR